MSKRYALRAARVLTGSREFTDARVEVEEGRITSVGPAEVSAYDISTIDLGDSTLAPGLIDLHVHGSGGAWFGQSAADDRAIAGRMAASGTTSCLASLGGRRTFEEVLESIRTTASVVGSEHDGVELLGIHMEGPYISSEKRGAWMPQQLRSPSVEELRVMQEAAGGTIKTMTIAPELPKALEVVAEAIVLGIRPAIGHTHATFEEARAGIDAGMTIATHTFNAMRGLHHRDPGALGAVLASAVVDAELIADGQHVSRGAMEVLLAAKGTEKVMLVTDNVALSGVDPGEYGEGQWRVTVSEEGVTLADGTIAGSVLPFNRHLSQMAEITGLPAAVRMATANPARAIGVDGRKGGIEVGMDADIVALSPELDVRLTINRGRIIFRHPSIGVPESSVEAG